MIEVYSKLFVGDELDYEHRVSHETGWAIIHVLCYIWCVDLTYKQQKEDSAGSIAQATLSADMMAPHFCEVEWEERPKARWSTS